MQGLQGAEEEGMREGSVVKREAAGLVLDLLHVRVVGLGGGLEAIEEAEHRGELVASL